ncbi:hypothetical protein W02_00900 [Nitrospira sp. KM1]|nr:hypothetical protein W02_00900 [Nitrospira sp. KM1]
MSVRAEVQDFVRYSERLLGLVLQTGELSEDECDLIAYYAKELHEKTVPFCTRESDCSENPSVG